MLKYLARLGFGPGLRITALIHQSIGMIAVNRTVNVTFTELLQCDHQSPFRIYI